jgi:hypothetical protein
MRVGFADWNPVAMKWILFGMVRGVLASYHPEVTLCHRVSPRAWPGRTRTVARLLARRLPNRRGYRRRRNNPARIPESGRGPRQRVR